MAGKETIIFEALSSRLETLIPAIPIAWPNLKFSPGNTGYLRANFLPNETTGFSVASAGSNIYRGIFQIDVFWPENKGLAAPLEKASAIIAHFKRGTFLDREGVRLEVDRAPFVAGHLQESGWLQVPVSIPWLAIIPN